MPFLRSSMPVMLTVTSGLHAGAVLRLGADTAIGQAAGNHMRLLDDGVAANHARLSLQRNRLTITPLDGATGVAGAPQAAATRLRLAPGSSIDIAFGPVMATLARPRRRGPRLAQLLALALGGIAVMVPWPVPRQGAAPSAASALLDPQPAQTPPAPPAAAPTHQQVLQSVTQRFAALQLNQTMQITVDGAGTGAAGGRALSTTISGVVAPDRQADFETFLAWYDAQPGWPALFNLTQRQSPAEHPLPVIAAVLLQPVPGLILGNGSRVAVGEGLPDGWTLTAVDDAAVVLTLDGQAHVITLSAPADLPAQP